MINLKNQQAAVALRNTALGPVAVVWSVGEDRPRVLTILISKPDISAKQITAESWPDAGAASCSEINALADQIEACLTGADIRFSLDMIHIDRCSTFQQDVLRAVHAIPKGRTSSYGLIAKHLLNPGAARAVGTALATNPFPIIIPCHRAVRSDGHLGGFQGGLPMKRALLKMEKVVFRDEAHVETGNLFYLNER